MSTLEEVNKEIDLLIMYGDPSSTNGCHCTEASLSTIFVILQTGLLGHALAHKSRKHCLVQSPSSEHSQGPHLGKGES